MKNLTVMLALAMVLVVSCRETEVPVDELKTNVEFTVTTENVTVNASDNDLKTAPITSSAPFFVSTVHVDAFRYGTKYNEANFDMLSDGPYTMSNVPLGSNTFVATNDMSDCAPYLMHGSLWHDLNSNTFLWPYDEYITVEEMKKKMRAVKPWMSYTCTENASIMAEHNDPIDMEMQTEHGRLIIVVELENEDMGLFATVRFKNEDHFRTGLGATINASDKETKKAYLYWSDENAKDGQEVKLDIFINEIGVPEGQSLKKWVGFEHPKLKVEAGYDRFVHVIISDEVLVKDANFQFTWTFDEDDVDIVL